MKCFFFLVFACFFSFSGLAEWKLNPLAYNHPELIVDLGVGLWASPLPMDYDEDGDLDLLVASSGKASNGVFFFENPGNQPDETMPIFKPAIRIGEAGHNMQISYVKEQSIILMENIEFVNFKKNGFAKRKVIYPNANFHGGQTRGRMWRYVDWEGDGDFDLMVGIGDWGDYGWDQAFDGQGRWRNGPLHGWVYLIKNVKGKFSKPIKVKANGIPIDVYGLPSPNLADFDGDGDLDLLCGEFLDGFTYFKNIGTRSEPQYASGIRLIAADGEALSMHVQMIMPTAIDWDGDGDVDLIVGDEDGRVALVENVSPKAASLPRFKSPVYFKQIADTLKFGALSTPFAYDWDGDGDEDILCGNTAGNIGLFTNLDGRGTQWSAPKCIEVDGKPFRISAGKNGSIQGPAEAKWGYTTFSIADWDGDGRDDFIVNGILPKLSLLRNSPKGFTEQALPFWTKEFPPKFYWQQIQAENHQSQWRTTPFAIDFDGDEKLDLVMLDQEGYLTCQSRARFETRIFVDENLQPIRLNSRSGGASGRRKLDVVDWDGDGRLDIIVNSKNAVWYRNCKNHAGRIVLKKIGNLARRTLPGHTTSPSTCDFDGNGKPDLIIGAEDGKIYFVKHEDCIQYSQSQLLPKASVPSPAPRFPGWISESFIFTEAPFAECHASTICQTPRGFVAAWFGGTKEKHPDVGIWSSYHDGEKWSPPRQWANGIQHETLRYPTWNPVLFQMNGALCLFFKVGPNPREWWGEMMLSFDSGRTFRNRRRLPEGIDGPVRSKPILLPNGTLLCPSSTEHDNDWRFHFEILSDLDHPELGESWFRTEPLDQPFQVIQPTLLTHSDGRIQALCRSKNERIIESFSRDAGRTWSSLSPTHLPNNNSGIEALTLRDGRHLLLYNHIDGGRRKEGWGKRNAIHLAISDDGKNWRAAAVIEKADQNDPAEFSYPAMIQAENGLIHLTYTWNRKRIRHLILDPQKLIPKPIESFHIP